MGEGQARRSSLHRLTHSAGVAAAGLTMAVAGLSGSLGAAADGQGPPVTIPHRSPDRSDHGQPVPNGFPAQACCGGGNGWAPGEPSLAVGPKVIVETVNASITVYNKSTHAQLAHSILGSFVGAPGHDCVDPRVIYWSWDDRFGVVCADTTSPGVRFAVSASGDPTGKWFSYSIAYASSQFPDQPKMVATTDKMVVSANNTGTNVEDLHVYPMADLLAGNPVPIHQDLAAQHSLYQPAINVDAQSDAWFVSAYAGSATHTLRVTGIPGTGGGAAVQEASLPSLGLADTRDPAIPRGRIGGGAMDTRVLSASWHSNNLLTFSGNAEYGSRVGTYYGDIRTGSSPFLVDTGDFSSTQYDITYGSVTRASDGTLVAAASESSAGQAPASVVVINGVVTVVHLATPGSGASGTDERWGDYMGVCSDPSSPATVWVAAMYQNGTGEFSWVSTIVAVASSGIVSS